jgi:transposase
VERRKPRSLRMHSLGYVDACDRPRRRHPGPRRRRGADGGDRVRRLSVPDHFVPTATIVTRASSAQILARAKVEIVNRSDQARALIVLPKRSLVERTLAWLGRGRRLAKDWECLNRKALAFLRLASIRLMLRNYAVPHNVSDRRLTRRMEENFSPRNSSQSLNSQGAQASSRVHVMPIGST